MYIARVRHEGRIVAAARTTDGSMVTLDHLAPEIGDDPVALVERFGVERLTEEAASSGSGIQLDTEAASFEPPVAHCSKLVCLALNYKAHAEEGNLTPPKEPVLFFKPPTTLIGHGQPVRCPARSTQLDHEVELAVVVGKVARDVPADQWRDVIAGYTILNDVTARDIQLVSIDANEPWDRSKGFDTFAPVGPWFVTPDEVPDPHDLDLRTWVDGTLGQDSNTSFMLFRIPELIEDITAGITLLPGDIIGTGTPQGIGPAGHGQTMEVSVGNLGVLRNEVIFEAEVAAPAVSA